MSESQTMIHLDSNNNIMEKMRDPRNTKLNAGGSSSGEGKIAAMKGRVFGLGSDIGGSVRGPAAFCAVWGLHPSSKRLSLMNTSCGYACQVKKLVYPVLRPLAGSADNIDLFMHASIGKESWKTDSVKLPVPWKDVAEPEQKSFCRGVVGWENIPVKEIVEAAYGKLQFGRKTHTERQACRIVRFLLPLTTKCFSFGCGDVGFSGIEPQKLTHVRDSDRLQYLEQMNAAGIGFILSPTYVSVAPKPETVNYWGTPISGTCLIFPKWYFLRACTSDPRLDAKDES